MESSPRIEKLGRVSAASVLKCTGKDWDQWVSILEKAGARAWNHREIVAFLKKRYKLGPWWQQGVCSGYELAIGRRVEGQNTQGQYTVTATKSLAFAAPKVWKFLMSPTGLAHWLDPLSEVKIKAGNQFETNDGFFGEVRTLKAGTRVRMTWQDPNWDKKTTVMLHIVPRPKGRTILVIDHSGILDLRIKEKMRVRWRKAVDGLAVAMNQG